jgi:hypothetical protein
MTEFTELEKLARRFYLHLREGGEQRFRKRRFRPDQKRNEADFHAEQTGGFEEWIQRDQWSSVAFFLKREWPTDWEKPEEGTPDFEKFSMLVLQAYHQFHIFMHDRFADAPEAAPIYPLFENLVAEVPEQPSLIPTLPPKRKVGRPKLRWGKIRSRLKEMDLSGFDIGKRGWRDAICRDIFSWYIEEFADDFRGESKVKPPRKPETLRQNLKPELDEILHRCET